MNAEVWKALMHVINILYIPPIKNASFSPAISDISLSRSVSAEG